MSSADSFNRYMVECEFVSDKKGLQVTIVLIDTWWNVNLFTVFVVSPSPGFNRYMVECEFQYISYFIKTIIVLIDTWWNVNYSFIIFTTSPKSF